MAQEIYRYAIQPRVPLDEVETSLVLALLTTESLHGESQTRLDAAHYFDTDQRACVIDAHTDVGRDLNKIFTGLLVREFGPDSFRVERVDAESLAPQLVPA
jgi:hypothetical protein